jgi:competence protein ComEA
MKRLIAMFVATAFAATAWAAEAVNVNTASAEEIAESLTGIGMSKAKSIVEYRETNGAFRHIDELVNVKGIGITTVDANRELILLEDKSQSTRN